MQCSVQTVRMSLQGVRRMLLTSGLVIGLLLCLLTGSRAIDAHAAPHTVDSSALPIPTGETLLVINGTITYGNAPDAAHLSLKMIQSLPKRILHTRTSVTDGVKKFEGPLMRDLLKLVGAQGKIVHAIALNDYGIDIPISDFYNYDVILATHMDDEQLQPTRKGPLWIVYPRDEWRQLQDIRYDYRWVWQLNRITIK